MRKKLFLLMTIACISFAFIGCGGNDNTNENATEQPSDNGTDTDNGTGTDNGTAKSRSGRSNSGGVMDDLGNAVNDVTNGAGKAIDDIGNGVDDAMTGR